MNERIRELARQAGALPTQDCGVPQWYIDEDEFEKFAELIVKECQTVVEWAISVDSTIDRVPVLIKEHFGVEE
jgi:broad-specificity NMP kinase